jgi:predicted MFS family arabinose efflux permease
MKFTSKTLEPMSPYWIWGVAALFFMYQFVLRVAPSILVGDLMVSFQTNASGIGSLSAIAVYFYSICQIPSGILSDRLGVRRVVLGCLSLCILGTLIFASSHDLAVAKLGRLILGIGSSAAFLCLGKIASSYFPPSRRATLFGMAMAIGTIGALNGGAPLAFLVDKIGWRQSLVVVSALGLVILFVNYLFLERSVRKAPGRKTEMNLPELRKVFANRSIWLHAASALGVYLHLAVLADLWGPSFVIQRFQVDRQTAAQTLSLMYVGLLFGSLTLSFLSDWLRNRKSLIMLSTFSICTLLLILLYYPGLTLWQGSVILWAIGFFEGAEMLCFTGASEASSAETAGTVTGLVNTVVMLSGALIQHQVGFLLDLRWSGQFVSEGVRLYSLENYQFALGILPALAGLSFMFSLFLPQRRYQLNR